MSRDRRRVPTRPKCLTCRGTGTIVEQYKDGRGRWQKREVSCPDCDGTGER